MKIGIGADNAVFPHIHITNSDAGRRCERRPRIEYVEREGLPVSADEVDVLKLFYDFRKLESKYRFAVSITEISTTSLSLSFCAISS